MPYSINRYNGSVLTVVEDGTIDNTLDIKLVGKNYAGYGEVQNENYVHLLENFSGTTAPPRPISGQVWFDSATKKLKFYDNSKWRTTGGAEVSASAPTGLTTGDFWWDTGNKQLYSWDGAAFVLVGPQGVAGSGTTQMRSRSVRDSLGANHAVIEAVTNGNTIFVISPDTDFTLDNVVNPINGFSVIKQGVTLINTPNTGVTTLAHRFWGTASNADKLGGFDASTFLQSNNANFTSVVTFGDPGFTVGASNDLEVFIAGGTTPYIKNAISDTIVFQTTDGTLKTPLKLVGSDLLPGVTNVGNIGSLSLKYATVYATTFNGTATQTDTLSVGGTYRSASASAGNNTIAARDSIGDLYANVFHGTATSARYADLAEKYLADQDYETGTVVSVGGEKEVTASSLGQQAIGVVSANPAFMMNKDLEGGTYIALKGRVPVKVIGSVRKGDNLIAANDGCAMIAVPHATGIFAVALESSNDTGVKLIEAIVL